MLLNHIRAILKGEIKKYPIYELLYFYFHSGNHKKLHIQIYEMIILGLHWKSLPRQYIEYEMFVKDCTLSLSEMKNYIAEKASQKYFGLFNQRYSIIAFDKAIFSDMMNYYGLPQPKTILKYSNEVFFDQFNNKLSLSEVDLLINDQPYSKLFLKDNKGSLGKGISLFKKSDDGLYHGSSGILTSKLIRNIFRQSAAIIQEGIVQNEVLSRLNSDSVNTIRILTKNVKGIVTIIDATLKVGRSGCFVDNAGSGGLLININLDTGKFGDFGKGYYNLKKFYEHPDSNVSFKDLVMPHWDEVKNLVCRAALAFHQLKFIGWDVAVTNKEAIIVEMNCWPSFYTQITSGGLFDQLQNDSSNQK